MSGEPLPFDIHPAAGSPIYQQIVEQAEALIASGTLAPGAYLPSVRDVARAATVNPMTVSKAYSRLEAAGLIERVRGRGMRVLAQSGARRDGALGVEERKQRFRDAVVPAVQHARRLGLTPEQARQVIDPLLKELEE